MCGRYGVVIRGTRFVSVRTTATAIITTAIATAGTHALADFPRNTEEIVVLLLLLLLLLLLRVTIVDVVRRLSSAGGVTSRRPRRRQRHAVAL